MKLNKSYFPHLTVKEVELKPGAELNAPDCGWLMVQVRAGTGYWMGLQSNHDLSVETLLVASPQVRGSIRASCLQKLALQIMVVEPARLTGLLTLNEQRFFETAAGKSEFALLLFSPDSATAKSLACLCSVSNSGGAALRLKWLQIFVEAFGNGIKQDFETPAAPSNAKDRLDEFLRRTPGSELLSLGVTQLARMTGCTPRHLNRIFTELVGVSFREKHTELRLARACELLSTTESKVVDVALESGYESLSLFNLMFARRYGLSPGKWRQAQRAAVFSPRRRPRRVFPGGSRFGMRERASECVAS